MGRGNDSTVKSVKSAIVVLGALAFGWLTIELAFKPFLEKARDAIEKSDPSHDPDDDDVPIVPLNEDLSSGEVLDNPLSSSQGTSQLLLIAHLTP